MSTMGGVHSGLHSARREGDGSPVPTILVLVDDADGGWREFAILAAALALHAFSPVPTILALVDDADGGWREFAILAAALALQASTRADATRQVGSHRQSTL